MKIYHDIYLYYFNYRILTIIYYVLKCIKKRKKILYIFYKSYIFHIRSKIIKDIIITFP